MQTQTLKQLNQDRAAGRAVVLATNLESGAQKLIYPSQSDGDDEIHQAAAQAVRDDKARVVPTAEGDIFLNVFNPPLRMIIIGAVHIAQALAPIARLAGYAVTVVDPRGAWATEQRFPGVDLNSDWPDEAMENLKPDHRTAIITLTHDPKLDDPALAAALRSSAFYIGSLGSTRTHAKRLQRLERLGFADGDFERIHGPVGLNIGAKSPAEIAISIMGQVTDTLRRGLS